MEQNAEYEGVIRPTADEWERAVEWAKSHYPEDVFPEDGTTIDCRTGRFARGLCTWIEQTALAYAADREWGRLDDSTPNASSEVR